MGWRGALSTGPSTPGCEIGPQPGQPAVDPAPRRGVNPETVCCLVHRAADDRCAAIEHVSERELRLHPLQSVLGERELGEERRGDAHRVDGRADVVTETGKGDLFGTGSAAPHGSPFEDEDPTPGVGDDHGRGQPVGPGTDDDGVVVVRHRTVPPPSADDRWTTGLYQNQKLP